MAGLFVVIAPHTCPRAGQSVDPGCDAAAGQYASQLYVELEKIYTPSRVVLLMPSENERRRGLLDPNRVVGRAHPLRRRLRAILQERGDRTTVIGVHSYAQDTPREARGAPWGAWEIIVLDNAAPPEPYSKHFTTAMRAKGFTVPLVRGAGNDIMEETREYGGRALLLEFNESVLQETWHVLLKATAESLVTALSS